MDDLLTDPSLLVGVGVGVICVGAGYMFYKGTSDSASLPADGAQDGAGAESTNYPGGKLSIYFGSQTGTAEGFARTLMEEGKGFGFDAEMVDLEDFSEDDMKTGTSETKKLSIFLMATYGEGEPTDNANRFSAWLKGEEAASNGSIAIENDLENLNFAVFGLGNRQYEHFNRMGKTINKDLEKFGGNRVIEYGEGDDDGNLEEDFDNWKATMWPSLTEQFCDGMDTSAIEVGPKRVTLSFTCKEISSAQAKKEQAKPVYRHNQIQPSTKHFFNPHSAEATVLVNRELREINSSTAKKLVKAAKGSVAGALEIGSTRHMEIDLKGTGIVYETADNLAVIPENSADSVNRLCSALCLNPDMIFSVEPKDASKFKYPFPFPCSLRDALTKYYDIHGLPRHSFVQSLLPYVQSEKQKQWLEELVAPDNHAGFKQYINGNGRSSFDLLTSELDSCDIPLDDLLHLLPHMQPRYYTISSSSSVYPTQVHITVSVTSFALQGGRVFKGLTSAYLADLSPHTEKVRVFVRPSSFRLPKKANAPIIMVGPGTGLAPMRALLQERDHLFTTKGSKGTRPSNSLYFGCKYSDVDFIYQEELTKYAMRIDSLCLLILYIVVVVFYI